MIAIRNPHCNRESDGSREPGRGMAITVGSNGLVQSLFWVCSQTYIMFRLFQWLTTSFLKLHPYPIRCSSPSQGNRLKHTRPLSGGSGGGGGGSGGRGVLHGGGGWGWWESEWQWLQWRRSVVCGNCGLRRLW